MSNVAIPHSRFKASILAVDDNPANLDVLAQMLAGASYEVRFATSGLMALGAVRAELPDLILLDVKMPGMDGLTVCRELKADPTTRDVPVIFISAQDAEDDKLRAFEAGGVDYVTKPFQPAEVIARVESQLKIARLTDELRQQVLRYQLNPHFLFNSFLSIRSLIDENPE
ncbi:MAG TPA: response regulator, partial [Acidobacteriota bacterium]|nr:response regulator [Acidobacteriota bacterium]